MGSTGPDLFGNLGSLGHNLVGNTQGGSGFDPTDLLNVNPMLGPLQDNGGPTQTMALLPGSPAINAGDPAQLGVADQRGVERRGGVNIGAYQASASALILTAPATTAAGVAFNLSVQVVDPFMQTAVGYRGTVHFVASNGAMADYTFTAGDAGQHTFPGLALRRAGPFTVSGTDTADGSITGSTTFTITPAAADHIALSVPSLITAGLPFAITVAVQDAYGNTVTGYLGTVHFTLTGTAIAQANYTFTASDMGQHTFGNLVLSQPGDYTLTGTDTMDPMLTGSVMFTVM
jgi:hypothetical protein